MVNVSNLTEMHGTLLITTIGWELRNDETGVLLASEFCGDGDFRGVTFVPKALVAERTELSVKKMKVARKVKVKAAVLMGVETP